MLRMRMIIGITLRLYRERLMSVTAGSESVIISISEYSVRFRVQMCLRVRYTAVNSAEYTDVIGLNRYRF